MKGWQRTRVPIQFLTGQFGLEFLLHHGHRRFGDDCMRHADHHTARHLLRHLANMPFLVAREDLVARLLDHPLIMPAFAGRTLIIANPLYNERIGD